VRERKDYGPLIDSGQTDWQGEPIYWQRVTVRNEAGDVIREGHRQITSEGEAPRTRLRYDNRGII
jgi:hypothetical protein